MSLIKNIPILEIFGAVFVVLFGIYLYFKLVLYNYWRKIGIVYIEPTVPLGNIVKPVIGKEHIGDCFKSAYEKMKKQRYFGMYTFHKPSLVVNDLELVKMVMTKEFNHFHDRGLYCNEELEPLSGHLFLLPGQKWKNLRAKLTPTFTTGKIKQMFGIVKNKGDALTHFLENKARNREIIEIKDITARYATDVIFLTAFGVEANSLKNPDSEFRYWAKKALSPGPVKIALSFFGPKIMDFLKIPFLEAGISEFFTKVFFDAVEYRKANNIRRKDFLDLLMQLINTGRLEGDESESASISDSLGDKITMMEAVAQAFVFFIAGFETSSTTISHCLYELAVNQDIQEKVREEIKTVINKHGQVTYDNLNEMTYLHQCVCEALRLFPPLAILNRVCTKDIVLPTTNLHVKKGIDVVIPVLGIHMDPEIYPDPEKFDPERFTEENVAGRHPYSFLPFGEGPRICIGLRFGYVQTKIGLISILNKFRVSLAPDTPVPLVIDPNSTVVYTPNKINLRIELLE